MSKIITGLCALLFFVALTASTAQADPIVVNSGSLTVQSVFSGPAYGFAGNNFTATASGGDPGNPGPASSCFPCTTGQSISGSSLFVGTSLGIGTVTINGSNFNVFINGQFQFSASSLIVPVTAPDISIVTLTTPFSFAGTMIGCVETQLLCQTQVFTTQLIGNGIATIQLDHFLDGLGNSLFTFRNLTYSFESAAVPEPTSILLVISGLAALGGTKLKRKNRSQS